MTRLRSERIRHSTISSVTTNERYTVDVHEAHTAEAISYSHLYGFLISAHDAVQRAPERW